MKRGYTLIEFLIVASIVGIAAAIVLPLMKRVRRNMIHSSCQSNLKQVGLGLMQYVQDYNEKLPPAAIENLPASEWPAQRSYGWVDAVQPYAKSYALFYCVDNDIERPTDSTKPNVTDYYLNRNLARRNLGYILDPATVILAGEGNDGRDLSNARYSRVGVPQSWARVENSPLMRHSRTSESPKLGGNYLFLDGHVKYLQGTSIPFGFRRAASPRY